MIVTLGHRLGEGLPGNEEKSRGKKKNINQYYPQ